MTLSKPQAKYFAHWLTLSLPSDNLGKLTASLQDAQVEPNIDEDIWEGAESILIGENGAGKSYFISFFELTKAIYDQRFGSYMLSNGGINAQLHRVLIDYDNRNAFFFTLPSGVGDNAFIEETGDYFNMSDDSTKNYKLWNRINWDKDVEESQVSENKYPRAKYNPYKDEITQIRQIDAMLAKVLKKPENVFLENGGIKEAMSASRRKFRGY